MCFVIAVLLRVTVLVSAPDEALRRRSAKRLPKSGC